MLLEYGKQCLHTLTLLYRSRPLLVDDVVPASDGMLLPQHFALDKSENVAIVVVVKIKERRCQTVQNRTVSLHELRVLLIRRQDKTEQSETV